jgi:hypothetical protein
MEPLNLMVSLSHFANDKRENRHGLSERAGGGRGAGRRRRGAQRRREVGHGWWRSRLQGVARIAAR